MYIHNGDLYDRHYQKSDCPLQINSCGAGQTADVPLLTFRQNGRRDWHIVYITAGEMLVRFEKGEEMLGVGDFFIYSPDEPQWYRASAHTRTLWLHFDGTAVFELLQRASLGSGAYRCTPDARTKEIFFAMQTEHHLSQGDYISGAEGYLAVWIAHLGNLAARHGQLPDKRLRKVLAHLNENYAENTSCEELARIAHMGRSRFLHLFHEMLGTSPLAYRTARRMHAARELLIGSTLDIAEIARTVGYDDPLYFSRAFRKSTGVSPTEFRKNAATLT